MPRNCAVFHLFCELTLSAILRGVKTLTPQNGVPWLFKTDKENHAILMHIWAINIFYF